MARRGPACSYSGRHSGTDSLSAVRPDELDRRLRERLDALGPAPRAELLHVLILPDFERADRIGSYWRDPKTRTFAELLIDCEEDRTLRAVLVGCFERADLDADAGSRSAILGSCSPRSPRGDGRYWLLSSHRDAHRIVTTTLAASTPTRTFAELLIHCEEDRTLRAVLVGMLGEADRNA
jgi:hypothetical protein